MRSTQKKRDAPTGEVNATDGVVHRIAVVDGNAVRHTVAALKHKASRAAGSIPDEVSAANQDQGKTHKLSTDCEQM